jgi:diketogulonate reductase-like aldo/keto reductase
MDAQFFDKTNIPLIGLGTWQLTGEIGYQATLDALKIGYRHIDTAHIYGNHKEIGQAIKDSGIGRNKIFITSKLWRDQMNGEDVRSALRQVLKEMQLDYLDLYLVHWPSMLIPQKPMFKELELLRKEGTIKNFGVSNCTINHIKDMLEITSEIATNQVEFHPSLNQKDLLKLCTSNNIILTAYSPIGHGHDLEIPLIKELAKKYDKSPAQICINWCLQKGLVALPKASGKERLKENFEAQFFTIIPEDIILIDNLKLNERYINPSFAEFEY